MTAIFRRFAPRRPEATLQLLDLWVAARDAPASGLAEIEGKVDALLHDVVKKQVSGKGEELGAAFPLILNQVKHVIDRRRAEAK